MGAMGRKLRSRFRLSDKLKYRLRKLWRKRLRKPLAVAGVTLTGLVLLVNLSVRFLGGGDPFPLSPRYIPQKLHALGQLLRHGFVGVANPDDCAPLIRETAKKHGVPIRFALAIARAESDLDPISISRTGAMGLMQLMPATARQFGVDDPFDARQSADGGVRFLAWLLKRYRGDHRRAAAAYNWGPGRVPRTGTPDLPSETKAYVQRVMFLWRER